MKSVVFQKNISQYGVLAGAATISYGHGDLEWRLQY